MRRRVNSSSAWGISSSNLTPANQLGRMMVVMSATALAAAAMCLVPDAHYTLRHADGVTTG